METMQSREGAALRQQNRDLEHAKSVGLACDDMASDIKFNLSKQTDQMQNSVFKNLYSI